MGTVGCFFSLLQWIWISCGAHPNSYPIGTVSYVPFLKWISTASDFPSNGHCELFSTQDMLRAHEAVQSVPQLRMCGAIQPVPHVLMTHGP